MKEQPTGPPRGESEGHPTGPAQGQPAFLVDAEEPLVLAGPPRAVRGEFRLQNPTAEKIIQKSASEALPGIRKIDEEIRKAVAKPPDSK